MSEDDDIAADVTTPKPSAQRRSPKKGRGKRKKASGKPGGATKKTPGGARRPFPGVTLEDALRIPRVIKDINGGNPWPPAEVARALDGMSARADKFWYLSAGARDYGLTIGTRDTEAIALAPLGRDLVYATSPQVEIQSLREAFFKVVVFKSVYDYYQGGSLPDLQYLQNTLESVFHVPPQYHDQFVTIYSANCSFLQATETRLGIKPEVRPREEAPHSIIVGEPKGKVAKVAFVIMPFLEKTDRYPKGFFEEVLRSLITPAAVAAGFKVETAKREGSDLIHSTIVNDLLAADLVIADLTEHNPNVLFELGLRMASEKPTALIRARGTPPIFDVDNLLRVLDYDPNIWPSTIDADTPRLSSHIQGTWDGRAEATTYMQLLRRR